MRTWVRKSNGICMTKIIAPKIFFRVNAGVKGYAHGSKSMSLGVILSYPQPCRVHNVVDPQAGRQSDVVITISSYLCASFLLFYSELCPRISSS